MIFYIELTLNNNPFISEKAKDNLYKADAVIATVGLQSKIIAGTTITAGVAVGGGVLVAETGLASAAGTALSTEFGYLASSGPLWQSLSLGSVGTGTAWSMFAKGASNLGGQIITNDFKLDSNINLWQTIPASFSSGLFSNTLESSFNINYSFDSKKQWNFSTSNKSEFISTFAGNAIGGKVGDKFDNLVKPLTDFSNTIKPIFDLYGGMIIEASENVLSKNVKDDLDKKFASPKSKEKSKPSN